MNILIGNSQCHHSRRGNIMYKRLNAALDHEMGKTACNINIHKVKVLINILEILDPKENSQKELSKEEFASIYFPKMGITMNKPKGNIVTDKQKNIFILLLVLTLICLLFWRLKTNKDMYLW